MFLEKFNVIETPTINYQLELLKLHMMVLSFLNDSNSISKGNTIYRIMPGERTLQSPLKKITLICVRENGANPKDVQCRLGHANINTTLQTYTHDTEDMQNQSVDIFERAASSCKDYVSNEQKYAHR